MKRSYGIYRSVAIALAIALGGCSTWNNMDRSEKGTAVGATGGAIVGAAVGGPVGAAVGAGVGGYAGHYETKPGGLASSTGAGPRYGQPRGTGMRYAENSDTVRSVQRALNDQGYDAGAVDGQMGPNTEDALRRFQQAQNLPQTGAPDARTLAALGVSNRTSYSAANQANGSNPSYQANESSQSSSQAPNRYESQPERTPLSSSTATGDNEGSETIRSVQQALNDQGYNAGAVDGLMGPRTGRALRQFQQAQNLRQTGRPDEPTLDALGVSNEASNQASTPASNSPNAPSSPASNQPSNQSNAAPNAASNAANEASDQTSNQSNLPGQPLNQGSNQASNPGPSNRPSQGSNPATNGSSQSNESNPSNDSNATTQGSNQGSSSQR